MYQLRLAHTLLNFHNWTAIRLQKGFLMKKNIILTFVILFGSISSVPASAIDQRGHLLRNEEYQGGLMTMVPGLNLSTDQELKINDLRKAFLQEIKPLRDKLFSLRGDLRLLWLEKNPDPAKIAVVQKEIRNLRDQIDDKRTAYYLAVLNILNPEQQIKLKEFIRQSGFRHGQMHRPERRPNPSGLEWK